MPPYQAVAIDFDGTLTLDGRLSDQETRAIEAVRARGIRVILATGRILAELHRSAPNAIAHFDAVVAENGAVLARGDRHRALAPSVSRQLVAELKAEGVHLREGVVLLAGSGPKDKAVLDALVRLGLEDQLVHNRGEFMVLPPGVNKASGVRVALEELGVSHHNLITIGDGENDHALLRCGELGVAVHNAVESLKAEADLVLDEPDGRGIVEFLNGPSLRAERAWSTARNRVAIGAGEDGRPFEVSPGDKVLVAGGTRSGKSHVAGLIAERLIEREYVVLIIDAEGDHTGLAHLPRVLLAEGEPVIADPGSVSAMLGHRFSSVVLDLSLLAGRQSQRVVELVLPHVANRRLRTGAPHWVVMDEAHLFATDAMTATLLASGMSGACLVTYVPAALPASVLDHIERAIVLPFGPGTQCDPNVAVVAQIGSVDPAELARRLSGLGPGAAIVLERGHPGELVEMRMDPRLTGHVRHRHKYAEYPVPAHLAFRFCSHDGDATGPVVTTIDELDRALRRCSPTSVRHHARRHDFSRWAFDVIRDEQLAHDLHAAEELAERDEMAPDPGEHPDHVEVTRAALLDAVERRYLR